MFYEERKTFICLISRMYWDTECKFNFSLFIRNFTRTPECLPALYYRKLKKWSLISEGASCFSPCNYEWHNHWTCTGVQITRTFVHRTTLSLLGGDWTGLYYFHDRPVQDEFSSQHHDRPTAPSIVWCSAFIFMGKLWHGQDVDQKRHHICCPTLHSDS